VVTLIAPLRRGGRIRTLFDTRGGQTAVVALVYLASSILITWPFAIHPGDRIFGVVGSDLTSNITRFRELAQDLQPPFLAGDVPDLDAPMGLESDWTVDLASISSSSALWALSVAFGGVAANGIWVIATFTLSALSMFLLARWVTGHAGASFLASLAFGFWPYSYAHASVPLGQAWVLVLLVWRMLVLLEQPSARNGLLAGLAGVLTVSWTHYWLLIGGVLYVTLAAVCLALAAARRSFFEQLRGQAISAALVLGFVGFIYAVASSSGFEGVPERATGENIAYSARPLMYVLPDPGNPFFGDEAGEILNKHYSSTGALEGKTAFLNPLYLGIATMLLGLVGALWTVRRFVRRRAAAFKDGISGAAVGAAAAVLVALIFSAPPEVTIRGTVINFPMHYVNQLTTTFRTTARFGLVVMLGLCIFAAIGARELLRRLPSRMGAALLVPLAVVIAADLYVERDPRTTEVTFPRIYATLRGEPEGILAEYPIDVAVNQRDNYATWHQDAHGFPLFNGYREDTDSESMKLDLTDLSRKATIPTLRHLGVRYLIIRRLGLAPENLPKPGSRIKGLRLLDQDEYGALYRVTAAPAPAIVLSKRGFDYPEGDQSGTWRWMRSRSAQLQIGALCDPCNVILRFRADPAFRIPRRLTFTDEHGRVIARRRIGRLDTQIKLSLRLHGRTVLTMTSDPPPRSARDLGLGPEARPLGVRFRQPLIIRVRTRG
jgi:hypothetical protein